jgi:acyl carrier protein
LDEERAGVSQKGGTKAQLNLLVSVCQTGIKSEDVGMLGEGERFEDDSKNRNGAPNDDSVTSSSLRPRPELPYVYVAPQTALQEVIFNIWTGILCIRDIGIEDDFFELGGDSVLATQIIARLREMFRIELPLIVLFDAPTIEKLAQYMIANEARPGLVEKTADVLKRIEGMTEDEVTRTLLSR